MKHVSLETNSRNGKVEDIAHTNKTIRGLKAQDVCLRYENLGDDSSLKLVAYGVAVHGNLPDGGSQRGYFYISCWSKLKMFFTKLAV